MNRAIFLDRDGTIIHDYGYNHRPDQLTILPGAAEALKELSRMGFLLFIVTNQSGIGRGIFRLQDFNTFQKNLVAKLSRAGVKICETYFCPHTAADACNCRKPQTGLVTKAISQFDVDVANSYFVGDKDEDVQCAKNIGCKSVRIQSDYPQQIKADLQVKSILELTKIIKKETDEFSRQNQDDRPNCQNH